MQTNEKGRHAMRKTIFIFIGLIILCGICFAQESELAALIKDRATYTVEQKQDYEQYVSGFSLTDVFEEEGVIVFRGKATLKRLDITFYGAGKEGGIKLFRSGNSVDSVKYTVLSETKTEEESGNVITIRNVEFEIRDNPGTGPFSVSYDIAEICTTWNGYMGTKLIKYDTITVTFKGKKLTITGFTKPKPTKPSAADVTKTEEEKPEEKKTILPKPIYNLLSKYEKLEAYLKSKKEKVEKKIKSAFENIFLTGASGGDVDEAAKQEFEAIVEFLKTREEDKKAIEDLLKREWSPETRLDYKVKGLFLQVVDKMGSKGLLNALDQAVTTLSGKKNSKGIIKEYIFDKDELEYSSMKETRDRLDVNELDAQAFNHVAKPPKKGLADKIVSFIPFGSYVSKKATKVLKKASKLVGFFESKETFDEKDFAKWAGNTYRFAGTVICTAIKEGKTKEEAINQCKDILLQSENVMNEEYIKKTKYNSKEEYFSGLVNLLEKNKAFEKFNTLRKEENNQ